MFLKKFYYKMISDVLEKRKEAFFIEVRFRNVLEKFLELREN